MTLEVYDVVEVDSAITVAATVKARATRSTEAEQLAALQALVMAPQGWQALKQRWRVVWVELEEPGCFVLVIVLVLVPLFYVLLKPTVAVDAVALPVAQAEVVLNSSLATVTDVVITHAASACSVEH